MYALRRIAIGEELSVSYLGGGGLVPRSERQAQLLRTKGFLCACETCCLSEEALERSEQRQRRIVDIRRSLGALDPGQASGASPPSSLPHASMCASSLRQPSEPPHATAQLAATAPGVV